MNHESSFTKEQLSQLIQVAQAINSSLELDTVLAKVMDITSDILCAQASSLLLIDEPGNRLFFKTTTGDKAEEVQQFTLKLGEGIAGCVAQTGKPIITNNAANDPRFNSDISETINLSTKSIICAPIKLKDKIIGVIEVINKIDDEFNENDIQLLSAITEQAALAIDNARLHQSLGKECKDLKEALHISQNIIGSKSAKTKAITALIEKVSPSDSTLLITGETGSGKELVARSIHDKSKRKNNPFVCVTCAILTETLLESELFGHEKGAFTGATNKKIGKFETAHKGTIFLDEISTIPPSTQIKLLRVLQEREFERVGGNQLIKINIRVIAATNEDIPALIQEGKFREDLYYRLKVIEFPVPPLRERQEDIPELVDFFLQIYSCELGRKVTQIHPEALKLLTNYSWPGNIRELRNVVERAVVLGNGSTLLSEHLPSEIIHGHTPSSKTDDAADWSLEEVEKWHIDRVLKRTSGNKSKASKILGISRNRLDRKL